MDLGLKDKVAIITGGSDGIGKAAAISMITEGTKVAIVGRTQSKLDLAVAEIKKLTNGNVIGISADVSVEADVQSMVNKVISEFGQKRLPGEEINEKHINMASSIQKILEEREIEFTGSGSEASLIAMNKLETKKTWRELSLPTADFVEIRNAGTKEVETTPYLSGESDVTSLGKSFVVKPARECSSCGVSIVLPCMHYPNA